jgi:hypothetical protein
MPDDYPWIVYEIDDSRESEFLGLGYEVLSPIDFESLKSSIDLTDYNNSTKPPLQPISPRQLRIKLLELGINDAKIKEAINSFPSPDNEVALISYEYSVEFDRYSPLVIGVGELLGLTNDQLDTIWIEGINV